MNITQPSVASLLLLLLLLSQHVTLLPCVLDALLQYVSLLKHLQAYRRLGPPSDVENSYLLENCLQPSALAQTRLPFHVLMHPTHYWKIICESDAPPPTTGRSSVSLVWLRRVERVGL